ncbi:MAG: CRISPR-associated endonuclease Cas1 [Comamonas sp.]|nr:CRISPR-associated endonuclease Cas1 [Comamonas sp.]
MTSLYVDRRDVYLQHDAGAIAFFENGQRSATVPLAPLTRLILRGKVTLEAALLGHLGKRGVGVLFLSGRNGEPHLLLGPGHNDIHRRVTQTRLSLDAPFCLRYARYLVAEKLRRQITSLDELREHYSPQRQPLTQAMRQLQAQLERLPQADNLDSLRGMEGAAAAAYFAGLRAVVPASLHFEERNRRPPRDPFNALLSLTYTIATAEVAMALHVAGYDPCIGYYHQISHSRQSLACDLLEPLRPLVDRLCLRLVAQQTLRDKHFSTSHGACLLGKAGRVRYYQAYEENARPLRRAISAQVKDLAQRINPDLPTPSTQARRAEDEADTDALD